MPTTPERRTARTSGASPSYSKVVPAPEFLLNVAVTEQMGTEKALRKRAEMPFFAPYWLGTSRMMGPRGAGTAGAILR